MIPQAELDVLLLRVTDAQEQAKQGNVATSRTRIALGLARARTLAERGVEYGEELVDAWTVALERFTEQFGEQDPAPQKD